MQAEFSSCTDCRSFHSFFPIYFFLMHLCLKNDITECANASKPAVQEMFEGDAGAETAYDRLDASFYRYILYLYHYCSSLRLQKGGSGSISKRRARKRILYNSILVENPAFDRKVHHSSSIRIRIIRFQSMSEKKNGETPPPAPAESENLHRPMGARYFIRIQNPRQVMPLDHNRIHAVPVLLKQGQSSWSACS